MLFTLYIQQHYKYSVYARNITNYFVVRNRFTFPSCTCFPVGKTRETNQQLFGSVPNLSKENMKICVRVFHLL